MPKVVHILVLVLLIAPCCSTPRSTVESNSPSIQLRTTGCRGKCPVYKIDIYDNGLVRYFGSENVPRIGEYSKKISKSDVRNLKQAFLDAKFFDLENEYTERVTDLDTKYLSFHYKGQTKTIRHYLGGPQELKNLENLVESIANSDDGWEKSKN